MSLGSWLERMGRERAFGSRVDTDFIPAAAARLQQELADAAEDRKARRADRAAAEELRKAQLASLERARQREGTTDLADLLRRSARFEGGVMQLPTSVPLAMVQDLPAGTEESVRELVLSGLLGARAQAEETRRLKTEERTDEDKRAEERAKRLANYNSVLDQKGYEAKALWDAAHPKPMPPERLRPFSEYKNQARLEVGMAIASERNAGKAKIYTPEEIDAKADAIAQQRYEADRAALERRSAPAAGDEGDAPFFLRGTVSPEDLVARYLGAARASGGATAARPDPLGIR